MNEDEADLIAGELERDEVKLSGAIQEDFPGLAEIADTVREDGTSSCGDSVCDCITGPEATRALAELQALRTDVANLLTWKMEASLVLGEWEKVWEALDRPGPLGASKAANVLREVKAARSRPAGRS